MSQSDSLGPFQVALQHNIMRWIGLKGVGSVEAIMLSRCGGMFSMVCCRGAVKLLQWGSLNSE